MSFAFDPDEYASEMGLDIIEPKPKELQLDIDFKEMPKFFEKHLDILRQMYGVSEIRKTVSQSGNIHVYIQLVQDITPTERILLQACLGSDLKRELLTFKNTQDENNTRPQFLYERKTV